MHSSKFHILEPKGSRYSVSERKGFYSPGELSFNKGTSRFFQGVSKGWRDQAGGFTYPGVKPWISIQTRLERSWGFFSVAAWRKHWETCICFGRSSWENKSAQRHCCPVMLKTQQMLGMEKLHLCRVVTFTVKAQLRGLYCNPLWTRRRAICC